MSDSYLGRLVDYDTWANAGLLQFLESQGPAVLGLRAAGVYGTIGETFEHLLLSEVSYHRNLLALPKVEYPQPETPTFDSLRALGIVAKGKLRGLVEGLPEPERMMHLGDGDRAAATIFTQLVMHGVEHRAHIGTILGANGIIGLELDSWAHGIFAHGDAWPENWGPEPAERLEFPSVDQR
ncbi:MAG: DinB family protein [Dehalococcoidia bacterium]